MWHGRFVELPRLRTERRARFVPTVEHVPAVKVLVHQVLLLRVGEFHQVDQPLAAEVGGDKIEMPVLVAKEPTAKISYDIQSLVVKIGTGDSDKVATAIGVMQENLDTEYLLNHVGARQIEKSPAG